MDGQGNLAVNVERMPKEGEMPIVVKGSRFWEVGEGGEGGAVGWMTFQHDSQCGAPKPPLLLLLLHLLLLLVLGLLILDLLELRELL